MTFDITLYLITLSIMNIRVIESTKSDKSGIRLSALFSSNLKVVNNVIKKITKITTEQTMLLTICFLRYFDCEL
jgi:hypothetical protein